MTKNNDKKCSITNKLKINCKKIPCSKTFIAIAFLLTGIIVTILAQSFAGETKNKISSKESAQEQQIKILQAWSKEVNQLMNDLHRKEMERSNQFFDNFYSSPLGSPLDPFEEMEQIRQRMRQDFANFDDIFDDQNNIKKADYPVFSRASVSQKEDEEFLYYQLNFSGFNKDNIMVNIKDDILSFSAKKEQNTQSQVDEMKAKSYSSSNFYYSFFIPQNIDRDNPEILKEAGKIIVKLTKINQS